MLVLHGLGWTNYRNSKSIVPWSTVAELLSTFHEKVKKAGKLLSDDSAIRLVCSIMIGVNEAYTRGWM